MAKTISVIIPNFNGKDLLAKNLPLIVKYSRESEIIVVDDGSSDGSVDFLQKKFKKIKIVALKKNQGFTKTANLGAQNAKGDLLVFLNSDVAPRPKFIPLAKKYFEDPKMADSLFAVGFADYSHEENKIVVRGRGKAIFQKGFVYHFAAPIEKGETFWASGGSGMFDHQKFDVLDGFDPIFVPFYWEDIDLSFRAWQAGYQCIFEPEAQVDHFHHEGTIRKFYSPFYIKCVAYKNQILFVWKNIDDPIMIMQHFLWLPYHFIKALITFDIAFFFGFIWAISKLPYLIFNYPLDDNNRQKSPKHVLGKFAKP